MFGLSLFQGDGRPGALECGPPAGEAPEAEAIVARSEATVCRSCSTVLLSPEAAAVAVLAPAFVESEPLSPVVGGVVPMPLVDGVVVPAPAADWVVVPVRADSKDSRSVASCVTAVAVPDWVIADWLFADWLIADWLFADWALDAEASDALPFRALAAELLLPPLLNANSAKKVFADNAPDGPPANGGLPPEPGDAAVAPVKLPPPFWLDRTVDGG